MRTCIEIFKTDVTSRAKAGTILRALCAADPTCSVHFDLDDCDRILRVEAPHIDCQQISSLLKAYGHQCEVLE